MTLHQTANRNCNRIFEVLTANMSDAERLTVLSGTFVAGGSLLHSEESPNDYDVFFKTPEAALTVLNGLERGLQRQWLAEVDRGVLAEDPVNPNLSSFKLALRASTKRGLEKQRSARHPLFSYLSLNRRVSMVTSNAVSLCSRIQLITRFIGPVEDILNTFDFEHCKVSWEPSLVSPTGGTLLYHGESARAIAEKTLVYKPNSRFIFAAMKRIEKFVKRGYSIPVSTIINLKRSFDTLDLSDPDVVEQELSNYYGINEELAARIRDFCLNAEGRVDIEALEKLAKEL